MMSLERKEALNMPGSKPTHRVCVAEEGSNGGDRFYTDVGAGWAFSGEKATGISIKLRPNIAVSGELVLFEARD